MKDLKIIYKLNKMVRVMNYIFIEYLKHVVNDIMLDPNSGWTIKENENEFYYMKIGHYLVNFVLYGKNHKYQTLEEFSQTDFYKNSGI